MIQNQNSLIEFRKPKSAKSQKWENYLQVFVYGDSQCFISCTNVVVFLHGNRVMEQMLWINMYLFIFEKNFDTCWKQIPYISYL